MLKLNTTPKFFPLAEVATIAAAHAAGDPDWKYVVVTDPAGKSPWARIAIYDECGEFVAYVSA